MLLANNNPHLNFYTYLSNLKYFLFKEILRINYVFKRNVDLFIRIGIGTLLNYKYFTLIYWIKGIDGKKFLEPNASSILGTLT